MMNDRNRRLWSYLAAAVVGGGALWVGAYRLLARPGALGLAEAPRLFLMALAVSLAMAWAVTFATLAYRSMDEFTREAEKFAWYWGGAIGAGVSAPIYMFISLGGLALFGAGPPPAERHAAFIGFGAGYGLMALSLLGGFAIARLWWSFSRR